MARLIDTCVFITLEGRRGTLADLRRALSDPPVVMSSITASELLHGVHRAVNPERQQRRASFVETLLAGVPIIPIDLDVARTHARIWAGLEKQGTLISEHDLLIAATALHYEYVMVTENLREFQRVPNLIIESPAW